MERLNLQTCKKIKVLCFHTGLGLLVGLGRLHGSGHNKSKKNQDTVTIWTSKTKLQHCKQLSVQCLGFIHAKLESHLIPVWYGGLLHTSPTCGRGRERHQTQLGQKEDPEQGWVCWERIPGRLCQRISHLPGGGRAQLFPGITGWNHVMVCHRMEQEPGSGVYFICILGSRKGRPGEGTLWGHLEKKGSPARNGSAVR